MMIIEDRLRCGSPFPSSKVDPGEPSQLLAGSRTGGVEWQEQGSGLRLPDQTLS